jgi:4-amino-4-deoxy-L-arabinose transferase-like glycosyltransferase
LARREALASNFKQEGKMKDERRNHWKLLSFIIALSFFLRVFLIIYPEPIHNDGTEYVHHAKEVLAGNWTGGSSNPLFPVLIALTYPLVKNYELAGILVSVIFGTLLILPVFTLGKIIFNEKVGMISALLTAVHPFLYRYSGYVLTESTYLFFVTTSVLFGWYAFSQGRVQHVFLFSFFASLAYLTKPEGIGFLFIFLVWVLFINPPEGRRVWGMRVGVLLLAVSCFLLFSSPYLIQLRKELGKWEISKKIPISIGSFSDTKETLSLEGTNDKQKIDFVSMLKHPLGLFKTMGSGLLKSFYKFQQGFNPLLFLLAILGWRRIFRLKSSHCFKGNLYIISHHFFYFSLIYPMALETRRYTSQMVSLSIPWAALGCLEVAGWLHRWIEKESLRKKVSLLLLLLLIVGLFVQGRVTHLRDIRVIRKETGLWMKSHLPRGGKVMSRMPQEAFYADLPWIGIPEKGYEEILSLARSKKVRYLVIDESIVRDSPGFLEKINEKDLILLKEFKDKDRSMVIFEVVYPEG